MNETLDEQPLLTPHKFLRLFYYSQSGYARTVAYNHLRSRAFWHWGRFCISDLGRAMILKLAVEKSYVRYR